MKKDKRYRRVTPSVPFVLFHVVIVLFLLTFTASDYPFGTFCPFSCGHCIIFTHIYCFEKLTDGRRTTDDGRRTTDGRRTPSDGNTSHDPLGQVS
jgi:hypothetical protein